MIPKAKPAKTSRVSSDKVIQPSLSTKQLVP